jgi:hypothetical protein
MYVCDISLIDEYAKSLSLPEWDGPEKIPAGEGAHVWDIDALRVHEPYSSQRQCRAFNDVVIR